MRVDVAQNRVIEPIDDLMGRIKPAVEHHGAKNSLKGIGKDRGTSNATALEFALTEQQARAEFESLGNFEEGLLLDQVGPYSRQVTFIDLAEALIEDGCHRTIQDAVPEELQALVVGCTVTAMGQGLPEEGFSPEVVAKPFLKLCERRNRAALRTAHDRHGRAGEHRLNARP